MNRKSLKAIALGLGGLALALVLTVGAFAVAGQEISEPAGVPVFTTPGPGASGADTSRSPEPGRTESPSPSDDHGGDSGGSATQSDSDGSSWIRRRRLVGLGIRQLGERLRFLRVRLWFRLRLRLGRERARGRLTSEPYPPLSTSLPRS